MGRPRRAPMLSGDGLREASAPAFCLGHGDRWQSEEADSGLTGCHIMHNAYNGFLALVSDC